MKRGTCRQLVDCLISPLTELPDVMLVRTLQPVQKTGDTSVTMISTMLRGVRRVIERRLARQRLRTSLADVWSNISPA